MLEYMGAWEWYDFQVKLAEGVVNTQGNKPAVRRGAAIRVMDEIQGKSVGEVGRVIEKGQKKPDIPSESAAKKARIAQRKHFHTQLARGRKLKEKLVKGLGLGILLNPKIWEYVKMDMGELEVLVGNIRADTKRVRLLDILGQQLRLLITDKPNLGSLLSALKAEALVSEEDYGDLKLTFALEAEPMPTSSLDTAVDSLIAEVSNKVFDKPVVEISCDTFNQLRRGEWLDNWMVFAGIQMSDKSYFVKCGYSIPFNAPFGRTGGMRYAPRPLAGWRKAIEAQKQYGQNILVHFRPLNINSNHFTLLEINEREKVIYHYDSKAKVIVDGRIKTQVGKKVEVRIDSYHHDRKHG
ncbi:hypothetical protein V8E54_008718 [Elaphomyces granulatus]